MKLVRHSSYDIFCLLIVTDAALVNGELLYLFCCCPVQHIATRVYVCVSVVWWSFLFDDHYSQRSSKSCEAVFLIGASSRIEIYFFTSSCFYQDVLLDMTVQLERPFMSVKIVNISVKFKLITHWRSLVIIGLTQITVLFIKVIIFLLFICSVDC